MMCGRIYCRSCEPESITVFYRISTAPAPSRASPVPARRCQLSMAPHSQSIWTKFCRSQQPYSALRADDSHGSYKLTEETGIEGSVLRQTLTGALLAILPALTVLNLLLMWTALRLYKDSRDALSSSTPRQPRVLDTRVPIYEPTPGDHKGFIRLKTMSNTASTHARPRTGADFWCLHASPVSLSGKLTRSAPLCFWGRGC